MVTRGWFGGEFSENPDRKALAVTMATVRGFSVIHCARSHYYRSGKMNMFINRL